VRLGGGATNAEAIIHLSRSLRRARTAPSTMARAARTSRLSQPLRSRSALARARAGSQAGREARARAWANGRACVPAAHGRAGYGDGELAAEAVVV